MTRRRDFIRSGSLWISVLSGAVVCAKELEDAASSASQGRASA